MIDNERKAREWLARSLGVSRETICTIDQFVELLRAENQVQNLVSEASLREVWQRHIIDSAQLLAHAAEDASWLDIGTGAGFPGLIIAALHAGPVTCIEPRKLRADFLSRAAEAMKIKPTIVSSRVEGLPRATFDVISARAVAPLPQLLALAAPYATNKTRFLFPKGRNVQSELEEAQRTWQGVFRCEPSLTDREARIVIIDRLRRKQPGKGP